MNKNFKNKTDIFEQVRLTEEGYYELKNKPTELELQQYYNQKYYQTNQGSYQNSYSAKEIECLYNKIIEKFHAIQKHTTISSEGTDKQLLDIGSGEGFALNFFHSQGWKVKGLDFSKRGCETQNPLMLQFLETGDVFTNMKKHIYEHRQYDIVWLDNVLEHVLDPFTLLKYCYTLTNNKGALVIEVPNDFSILQKHLIDINAIDRAFWVAIPDHISYFNREGLITLCDKTGWEMKYIMGDFPIDISLLNHDTNYVSDKSRGRNVHLARVELENLLHKQSVEKMNTLYGLLAELGFGRNLIGIFQKKSNK